MMMTLLEKKQQNAPPRSSFTNPLSFIQIITKGTQYVHVAPLIDSLGMNVYLSNVENVLTEF